MGYNKIVLYGEFIETYEYQQTLRVIGRRKRTSISTIEVPVGSGGFSSDRQNVDNTVQSPKVRRQDNAKRAEMEFRRLVQANLGKFEDPSLFTLTTRENTASLRLGYASFSTFIQRMRRAFGSGFRYIAVPEWQRRGAIHFHALFWGIPESILRAERHTRLCAGMWGQGYVYIKKTDGSSKLGVYLSKYMAKTFRDTRLFGGKAYVASRNVLRPVVYKNVPVWIFEDDYKLKDMPLLTFREYHTLWLGRGIYKKYLIK